MILRKRQRIPRERSDLFDNLPDDLLLSILSKLSSSASSPSDFINVLLTCRRMNRLGLNPTVLVKLGPKALSIKARNWSDCAHRFLKLCVLSGNIEAHYILGMIRFYCLQNGASGTSLMAKAAIKSHAPSLYSLAVIQFNGSGKTKAEKDLRAGVALCARAAFLGHIDALRELGHCLQDGYGVRKNIVRGRNFLVQANARELVSVLRPIKVKKATSLSELQRLLMWHCQNHKDPDGCPLGNGSDCPILSDFGCDVPSPEEQAHPANRFLTEWFGLRELGHELRLCSNGWCGRPETRPREFRRCSVCSSVHYCSRGCQALHWKSSHKDECTPNDERLADGNGEMDQLQAND